MASKHNRYEAGKKPMLFGPWNYKVLALGFFLIVVGFVAMYLENEVHGFISLYISPIVIMAGYLSVIVAIMKHDDTESSASSQSSG